MVGYLSGGVDSAYVLATAAKVRGTPIPSFTIKVPHPELDEEANATVTARAVGGAATMVEAGPNVIAETYAALIGAAETPVLDTSCAALLALSREVHAQGGGLCELPTLEFPEAAKPATRPAPLAVA